MPRGETGPTAEERATGYASGKVFIIAGGSVTIELDLKPGADPHQEIGIDSETHRRVHVSGEIFIRDDKSWPARDVTRTSPSI